MTRRMRIRIVSNTIEEQAHANVARETAEVTHVPVGRIVEAAHETRVERDVTIVPVFESVLVVEKRLVLEEALHIDAA